MIPCKCVDNSNCPIDFPLPSQWLEKGKEYHIIAINYVPLSKTVGFKLFEKKSEDFSPYLYFRSDRFVFDAEYLPQVMEMIEGVYREEEKEEVQRILESQPI